MADQRAEAFDVVVADDGSGPSTRAVIDRWRERLQIAHVWQPDEGYGKARALNLAALEARGQLLIFLDGDSIPRCSFLELIRKAALPGRFLVGKRLKIGSGLTRRVIERGLPVWRWSAAHWLLLRPHELRRPGFLLPGRDRRRPWREGQPEFEAPYGAYGVAFTVWRADFEHVNGYDMRFEGWGAEDAEIAVRLQHAGLRCGWPGPRSTILHLCHPHKVKGRSNMSLLRETEASGRIEAVQGLRELREEKRADEGR